MDKFEELKGRLYALIQLEKISDVPVDCIDDQYGIISVTQIKAIINEITSVKTACDHWHKMYILKLNQHVDLLTEMQNMKKRIGLLEEALKSKVVDVI